MVKGGEEGSEWRRRNMGKGVGKDGRERGMLFKSKSGREGRFLDASAGGLVCVAQVASATNSMEKRTFFVLCLEHVFDV
jgi:hypothetical protein